MGDIVKECTLKGDSDKGEAGLTDWCVVAEREPKRGNAVTKVTMGEQENIDQK